MDDINAFVAVAQAHQASTESLQHPANVEEERALTAFVCSYVHGARKLYSTLQLSVPFLPYTNARCYRGDLGISCVDRTYRFR